MKRLLMSLLLTLFPVILCFPGGNADRVLPLAGPSGEIILGLGTLKDAAFSPLGNYVVTGGSLGAMVWESGTGALVRVLYNEGQGIQCVAFTSNGTHLLGVGPDRSILWEVESGRPVLSFPAKTTGSAVAVSPDGQFVFIGNYDGLSQQYMAEMWSLKTGTIVNQIGWGSGPFQSIAVSPDGQYLLTATGSGAQAWDIYNGAMLLNYPYGGLGAKAVFSPDGTQVLIQSTDFGAAYLFNWMETEYIYTFSHKTGTNDTSRDHFVYGAAFLPGGRQIATISGNAIRVWENGTGKLVRTAEGPLNTWLNESEGKASRFVPDCYVFSPAGRLFLSVDRTFVNYTYSVSLWSFETGKRVRSFGDYNPPAAAAAFSPDSALVCLGGGRLAQVWNIAAGKIWQLYTDNLRGKIDSVCFSRDQQRLCIVDSMGATQIRNTQTWETVQTFRPLPGIFASFSPDGAQLLTGGHSPAADYAYLWDITSGQLIRSFREEGAGTTANAASTVPSLYPNWFNPAVFSPDGAKIATGCNSEFSKVEYLSARLWDSRTGALIRKFTKHADSVVSVAYSSDGRSIATGSKDQTAKIWEVETGNDSLTFTGHHGTVYSVKLSQDGRYLLTVSDENCSEKPVILWDARSGRELAVIRGHHANINAADFSPDGRKLLTAGDDGTVRIWDMDKCINTGADQESAGR
ncbi:MAG: WD40 repeat domain-containing protein [bacterium]